MKKGNNRRPEGKTRASVTAALIVKNEESVLDRCLSSIEGVVDDIVVVDTGSSDATLEIAKKHGARTFEIEWTDDFSQARNFALDQVKTDWVLQIDADEELAEEDRERFREIVDTSKDDLHGLLIMDISQAEVRYFPRLFRNIPGLRYKNRVHEYIDIHAVLPDAAYTYIPVKLNHYGYAKDLVLQRGKVERNYELAKEALKRSPGDVERIFDLARYESMMKSSEEAVRLYRQVIKDGTNQVFAALSYKRLLEQLALQGKYEEAVEEGIQAIKAFPEYTDMRFLTGINCLKAARPRKAMAFFKECLGQGEAPDEYERIPGAGSVLALLFYGYCLQAIRDRKRAEEVFSRALGALRREPMALVYLAKVMIQNDGREAALGKIKALADLSDTTVRQFLKVHFPELA